MSISRRKALGAAASLLATVPIASQARDAAPNAPATEDFGALSSQQEIWERMLFLVSCGTRNTGLPGHVKFVDFLARKLGECPGVQVSREGYSLRSVGVHTRYALSVQQGNQHRNLHATSAYPYSGEDRTWKASAARSSTWAAPRPMKSAGPIR